MKYCAKIFCRDCTGVDELGCNDGQPWFLDKIFDTLEEAEKAADDATRDCGPWDYEIETGEP